MQYIVVKDVGSKYPGGSKESFGPISADSGRAAIEQLAAGTGKYVAQKRGRYWAIPLDVWRADVYDWTAARGAEPVPR